MTERMLWDPGFESWQYYGVTGQPTWILFSAQGKAVKKWSGPLPEKEILALL